MNLYRRHLNESQRAMVAAALLEPFEKEAEEEKKKFVQERPKDERGKFKPLKENLPAMAKPQATDEAGQALGVSGRSVRDAKVIREEGTPKEIEDVTEGKTSVSATARQVRARRPEHIEPQKACEVEHLSDKLAIIRTTNSSYHPTFNPTNDNINWAAWSWNPVTGCLHGCEYCYARAMAENNYYQDSFPTKFKPTFRPDRLSAPDNTHIPKGKENIEGIRRVFVCSMADLFGAWVPADWIQSVVDSCNQNQQWDFLFLTKNPRRYLEFEFPKNCWLGATADTQKRADVAIDVFKRLYGKNILFLSCEPLLEEIIFRDSLAPDSWDNTGDKIEGNMDDWRETSDYDDGRGDLGFVNLLIIGALKNSENSYRQPEWKWVESLIIQASSSNIHYVFKPNLTVRPSDYPKSLIHRR
jgi:protein gp37